MAFFHCSATTTVLLALYLLVIASIASSPSSLLEQQDDMSALLHLKRALISNVGSDFGDALHQWSPKSGTHHCFWRGVTCDAWSGRVVALAHGGHLSGKLSPVVSRLTELKALSFPSAGLHGEIPPNLWRLRCLQMLNLTGNSLHGRLPATFSKGLKSLDLSGNQLNGELPPALGTCTALQHLRLSSNSLAGTIPPQIGELARLLVLDLSNNRLTGIMPPELLRCRCLVQMDLSGNLLHGGLPSGLSDLKNLTFLELSGNNFSGEIPSILDQFRSLEFRNLSNNSLSREVPIDFVAVRNHTTLLLNNNKLSGEEIIVGINAVDATISPVHVVTAHSVTGELFPIPHIPTFIREMKEIRPGTSNGSTSSGDGGLGIKEIVAIASASSIAVVLLVALTLCICTRKWPLRPSKRTLGEVKIFSDVDIGVPLTYETVVRATGDFNPSNCIDNSGFGTTYRAKVAPGVLVAIKRSHIGKLHSHIDFEAEVTILGQCRHPHLVTLLGYHKSDFEMFLVYNYLSGGNLERFIQERGKRPISWRRLHKIALDVASALAYMHDESVPRILHLRVKPSNILLDNECNAYLSDFGLARLLRNCTCAGSTFRYVAPEYAMTGHMSDKADVYSYGVVLLELISEKKAQDPPFSRYGHGLDIVSWAMKLIQSGRVRELFIEGLWEKAPHDDLVEVLSLAVRCTQESVASRPTMKHVVRCLREIRPPYYQDKKPNA